MAEVRIRRGSGMPDATGALLAGVRNVGPDAVAVMLEDDDGKARGTAYIEGAEASRFAADADIPPADLDRSAFLSVVWASPDEVQDLPVLLYAAGQRARVLGRTNIVTHLAPIGTPISAILHLEPLRRAPTVTVDGESRNCVAGALDLAMMRSFGQCNADGVATALRQMPAETLEIVQRWVEGSFFRGRWACAIMDGNMTREQYIACLYNMHHYVRQTTRHLGRAVGATANRELRSHWIEHLNGEINHEVSIELDLKTLGVDPSYVMNERVPTGPTKLFMAVQESTIGFYRDPIALIGCPLAAEGITAHLKPEFLDALYRCISGWGIKEPRKVARFLTSHTHTDGGDDGHFEAVVQLLGKHVTDETMQQRLLSVLGLATESIERSFNSAIEDNRLWG